MCGGYRKAASYWSRDQLLSCLYKRAPICIVTTRKEHSGSNRRIRRRDWENKEYDGRKEENLNPGRGRITRLWDSVFTYTTETFRQGGRGVHTNTCEESIIVLTRVMQREYLRVSELRRNRDLNGDYIESKLWYNYLCCWMQNGINIQAFYIYILVSLQIIKCVLCISTIQHLIKQYHSITLCSCCWIHVVAVLLKLKVKT